MNELNEEILLSQKYSLIEKGFIWNPLKESFQRLRNSTGEKNTFTNVIFKPEEKGLWVTDNIHDLSDDSKYYMYILFLGKIPKSVEYFNSIINTLTTKNYEVNNEMIRYIRLNLEKHGYVLTDSKCSEVLLPNNKKKTNIKYTYEKDISDYTLISYIEIPENKLYVGLWNETSRAVLLDTYIPKTIAELNIILNHIPIILQNNFNI